MGRLREFEPSEILDQIMHIFWQNNFQNVSYDHLVKQTGVNRHGLYQVYGDKANILLKSLRHYEQTILLEPVSLLRNTEKQDALKAIGRFFSKIAFIARYDAKRAGCLLCNTHIQQTKHKEIKEFTTQFFKKLKLFFLNLLKQVPILSTTPEKLASYLVGLVLSVSINAQILENDKEYDAFIKVALTTIR